MNSFSRWNAALWVQLVLVGFAPSANAELLQIIHTNDLHAHFVKSSDDPTLGGFAAVKAQIDILRSKAQAQGIPTLVLDGGDFSEGSPYYFVERGQLTWGMIEKMGYDAMVLGNHDWLVGPEQVNDVLGTIRPRTPILSANFKFDAKYEHMNKYLKKSHEVTKGRLRIGIVGLSTNEFFYNWRSRDGKIEDPIKVARDQIKQLKKTNDMVIALTHLGVDGDTKLALGAPGLDLIVGGHSHTLLKEAVMVQTVDRKVPIVQVGKHGEWVGDLLVGFTPGKPLKVVHYRQVAVPSEGPHDEEIDARIMDARHGLEKHFGKNWLYETIAFSELPLEKPEYEHTPWGDFVTDSFRLATGAEAALDMGHFYGGSLPSGAITRERIIEVYPRTFDLRKHEGWTLWKIKVPGWLLQLVIGIVEKSGNVMNFSNVTYDKFGTGAATTVGNIKVGGKKLGFWKNYEFAVSEGLGRGGSEISILLKLFFRPKDTGISVWSAIEKKLLENGPVFPAGGPGAEAAKIN